MNRYFRFLPLILLAAFGFSKPTIYDRAYSANQDRATERQLDEANIGIGFYSPNIFEHPVLHFYGGINAEKSISDHTPMDSVVFCKDEYGNMSTSYAPPWLYPEHLKLDYGIMIFKVIGVGHDFIKAETNRQTKQEMYLNKKQGMFMSWPEFLMTVNSVELKEDVEQKIRIKPLDYAGEVTQQFSFLKPLIVQEKWMYVKLVDDNYKDIATGWIRWKDENGMLITYSLLS